MDKAIQFLLINEKNQILLEKRDSDDPQDPNVISIPGGHIEEGETPEEALKRELKEELYIENVEYKLIATLPYISSSGKNYELYYYQILEWDGKYVPDEIGSILLEDFYIDNLKEKLTVEADKIAITRVKSTFSSINRE